MNVHKAAYTTTLGSKLAALLQNRLPDTAETGRKTALQRDLTVIGSELVKLYAL